MKVPAAPLVVSSAVKDNDKAKEAVYAFLKYYYGEEAAKISYEGSIFPATNYDGIAATDSQYAMNAMITALGNGWKTPKAAPDQTVTPAVQEAMYDAIFGVMQGTYSPKDALKIWIRQQQTRQTLILADTAWDRHEDLSWWSRI